MLSVSSYKCGNHLVSKVTIFAFLDITLEVIHFENCFCGSFMICVSLSVDVLLGVAIWLSFMCLCYCCGMALIMLLYSMTVISKS